MEKMKIIIKGEPMAKQSVRISAWHDSKNKKTYLSKYQPKKTEDWKNNAQAQIAYQLPKDFKPFPGAVRIKNLTFIFKPLKAFSKKKLKFIEEGGILYKETKPDLMDNLNKLLFDSCNGVLFLDDSRIVEHEGKLRKIYGLEPRIEFEIEEIKGDKL